MFTPLDNVLFPDDCRVVHIPLCNQWIYWIQKNGTSSLRKEYNRNNYQLYCNEEIKQLPAIDIYIRDARSRYVSGVSTFVEFLSRDHPELDTKTIFWFAKNFKFLNRHYLPQFFWLLNLSRYLAPECQLRFHSFENFYKVTTFNVIPTKWTIDEDLRDHLLSNNPDMELWFFVDQILEDLSGQSMNWQQLICHYQERHPETWDLMISKISKIYPNVLS